VGDVFTCVERIFVFQSYFWVWKRARCDLHGSEFGMHVYIYTIYVYLLSLTAHIMTISGNRTRCSMRLHSKIKSLKLLTSWLAIRFLLGLHLDVDVCFLIGGGGRAGCLLEREKHQLLRNFMFGLHSAHTAAVLALPYQPTSMYVYILYAQQCKFICSEAAGGSSISICHTYRRNGLLIAPVFSLPKSRVIWPA